MKVKWFSCRKPFSQIWLFGVGIVKYAVLLECGPYILMFGPHFPMRDYHD